MGAQDVAMLPASIARHRIRHRDVAQVCVVSTPVTANDTLRHVSMGNGIRFDPVATEWRENSRVSGRHRFDAESFPPGALDDHVRIGGEYFDVGDTTVSLLPERGGTRLTIQMRYRVSTHFNWYAGPVADFLVGDFAEQVLGFYARRAERGNASPGP